jgi:hypothetical protein
MTATGLWTATSAETSGEKVEKAWDASSRVLSSPSNLPLESPDLEPLVCAQRPRLHCRLTGQSRQPIPLD